MEIIDSWKVSAMIAAVIRIVIGFLGARILLTAFFSRSCPFSLNSWSSDGVRGESFQSTVLAWGPEEINALTNGHNLQVPCRFIHSPKIFVLEEFFEFSTRCFLPDRQSKRLLLDRFFPCLIPGILWLFLWFRKQLASILLSGDLNPLDSLFFPLWRMPLKWVSRENVLFKSHGGDISDI